MLIEEGKRVGHRVDIMTAASPPPAKVLKQIEEQGFSVTHVYGLTEVYGPAVVCEWKREWDQLDTVERADLKSRQGVRYPGLTDMRVMNVETKQPVAADGKELGEVFMRGNIVMMGYYKNERATREAFVDGWFHTGDLGVVYPDGYIQLKDRSKDIIISGGENISTIELEGILVQHPDIIDAAVVGIPDEKWGEVPCAFLTLKNGSTLGEEEIKKFCKENMAGFKIPKKYIFGTIENTVTGKVQKGVLRKKALEV
jgi:fatty-acyl-CoA synthase